MFFKIIKQSNYRLLLTSYHKYSRLKIEFDLLDRELGEEFPFIKDFYLSFFIYLIYGIFSYRSQLRSQQVLPEKEVW